MKRFFIGLAIAAGLATATFAVVNSTASSISYTGNGSISNYTVPFPFASAQQLVVSENGTTKTLGTDYSVTGIGSSNGGSITLTAALGSGVVLKIARIVGFTQPFSFRSQSFYDPSLHEQAFDNLEYQIQEISSAQADGGTFGGVATSLAPGALVHDATLTGDGSNGNALGVNLDTFNVWTNGGEFLNNLAIGNGGLTIATNLSGGGLNAVGTSPFDFSGASGVFKTSLGPFTLENSSLVTTSNLTTFDLSASAGTFKTPTGAATFGGSSNTFAHSILISGTPTPTDPLVYVNTSSANAVGLYVNVTGSGAAAMQVASTLGYGIQLSSNATYAGLTMESQAAPSVVNNQGDMYFDSTALAPEWSNGTKFVTAAGLNVAQAWSAGQTWSAPNFITLTSSSPGLTATNSGTGIGLSGANAGSGIGVNASASGGTGIGLEVTGNNTRAGMNLAPHAAPSTATTQGDLYYDTTLKRPVYSNGAAFQATPRGVQAVCAATTCTSLTVEVGSTGCTAQSIAPATATVTGCAVNSGTGVVTITMSSSSSVTDNILYW